MKWDTTGAAFGDKYRGWVVRILDSDGTVVLQQASSAFLAGMDKLPSFSVGDSFDKQGRPMSPPRS